MFFWPTFSHPSFLGSSLPLSLLFGSGALDKKKQQHGEISHAHQDFGQKESDDIRLCVGNNTRGSLCFPFFFFCTTTRSSSFLPRKTLEGEHVSFTSVFIVNDEKQTEDTQKKSRESPRQREERTRISSRHADVEDLSTDMIRPQNVPFSTRNMDGTSQRHATRRGWLAVCVSGLTFSELRGATRSFVCSGSKRSQHRTVSLLCEKQTKWRDNDGILFLPAQHLLINTDEASGAEKWTARWQITIGIFDFFAKNNMQPSLS